MEPNISYRHVPQALRVIQNVCTISRTVRVNKLQCKRIADRFSAIGEGLTGVGQDQNFAAGKAIDGSGVSKDYPDLDGLLAVLRKGKALVSQCRGINSVIFRTDKPLEAFQKIHAELDTLKAQFDFEDYCYGFAKDCDTTSGRVTGEARSQEEGSSLASHLDSELGDVSVPEYLRIDPSDIQFVRKIGCGASAKVYESTWSGCRCAVKRFDSACMSIEYIPILQKELDFLIQLRHPYMVQLLGLSVDPEHQCSIVMEIMSCSLRELIDSRMRNWNRVVPFDFHEAVLIIKKIAYGMAFLHSRGVSHRDLKSRNVMVEEHPGSIDVKIVDFGESQFLDSSVKIGSAGTTCWMAPEILPRPAAAARSSEPSKPDLKAADVYSFAMTCYEVLTGEEPFSGRLKHNQYDDVRSGHMRPQLPGDLEVKLKGLIETCWDSDPKHRPNFESICYVLNQIRFENPTVVTNSSSGIGVVVRLFKQIPFPQAGLFTGKLGLVRGVAPKTYDSGGKESLLYDSEESSLYDSENESELHNSNGGNSAISVPEYLRIKHVNLRIGRELGRGLCTRVYAATWLGCIFAVKMLYFGGYPKDQLLRRTNSMMERESINSMIERDISFMIELRHPHIVQLVGVSVDSKQRCSIVMEIMGANLQELVESRMWKKWRRRGTVIKTVEYMNFLVVPFDLHEVVLIIRKIALGMAFLHSRGVFHGNLKPQNVMVNEVPGSIDVKIQDFRSSQQLGSRGTDMVGPAGTPLYMAPEIIPVNLSANEPVDLKAADVYSFAMTCYGVFTGHIPFLGLSTAESWETVIRGGRPPLPADLHPELKVLIEKCWQGDPSQRPNFTYICEELQRIQQALPSSSS